MHDSLLAAQTGDYTYFHICINFLTSLGTFLLRVKKNNIWDNVCGANIMKLQLPFNELGL